ncbi:hypothetical protein LINGRAHAP2_LOCUS18611 [Linum grandiflorum]
MCENRENVEEHFLKSCFTVVFGRRWASELRFQDAVVETDNLAAQRATAGNSGGSSDVVEANMSVLKERIQQVQIKERMSLTYPAGHRPPFSRMTTDQPISTASSSPRPINIRVSNNYGWNYGEANMVKSRRRKNDGGDVVLQMLKVIGLVSSTVGITCLSGTGLLCLVSLLTHDFSHQF